MGLRSRFQLKIALIYCIRLGYECVNPKQLKSYDIMTIIIIIIIVVVIVVGIAVMINIVLLGCRENENVLRILCIIVALDNYILAIRFHCLYSKLFFCLQYKYESKEGKNIYHIIEISF